MPIKLIENTGYKYDKLYRFYGWEYADKIKPTASCGVETLGEFYFALLNAWTIETCSERFRDEWSQENPSVGQCTITAALVREYFGGEIMGLPLTDGGMHSFNRIDGIIVDLACEQFGENALLDFDNAVPVEASSLLAAPDKAKRYAILQDNFMSNMHSL